MKKKSKDSDSNSGAEKRKCFQCRVLLDEDESFCVACGASNPVVPFEKRLKMEMKMEKRLKYLRWWNRLISRFTRRPPTR